MNNNGHERIDDTEQVASGTPANQQALTRTPQSNDLHVNAEVGNDQTDDAHPVHLHRNTFELTNVHGKPTAGVMKDVAVVKGFRKIDVDFTAEQTGLTLFHCHQQLHMDYGFKTVFNVA